ncbi:oligosaccharide repeat unit polymerase [Leuconostoc citreum]|uniref:O-antigen polymerase n=1 Tax=Leuconostoc citreum TaxID=33964 RepID=UPI0021A3B65A|nr:O-antigen polymerase [Leuconostoc citreum]MCT3054381.1 oligosaccharide repeat unit polymerase [Leuconostoc citreum]MCT3061451.1 oligosaccharide repeat unit polymerase [Leuconostoc citreum]
MIIIGISLLILVVMSISRKKFDFTKSIVVFIVTWITSLFTYESGLFSNYPVLSFKTWFFIISTILFTTSLYFVSYQINWKAKDVSYDLAKIRKSADLIMVLVFFSFLGTVYKLGLPPTLGGGVIRSEYYVSGFETIYLLIYLAMFLYIYIAQKTKSIKLVWVQFLVILILIILKANKFAFFVLLLTLMFFFGKKIKIGRLLIIVVGIIGVFILASMLYISKENEYVLRSAQISELGFKLPYYFAFLIDPLVYLSSNIVNLNAIVNSQFSDWNYGAFSFKIIWQNFSFLFPSAENKVSNTANWINSILPFPWLNTYSALGSLYVDFGTLISIMILSISGFFAGIFDKLRSKRNSSLILLFFGLTFYQLFAFSFFSFYFTNKEIITNIIVLAVVHIYARKGNNEYE